MMRRHRPFDIVLDCRGTWIVSRTGRYRRWCPAMHEPLARRRARASDAREMML